MAGSPDIRDEQNQRKINALVSVGRVMASTADYEQALAILIETVSRILGVETGGFMLYDARRDELVLQKPAFGIHDERLVAAYHVALAGGGNAVRVFLSRQPYMTNDVPNDPRVIRRFAELFGARNILTVPLVVEDWPIGVFHAINKRQGGFTRADVDLLSLVAPLLAVSIQSAGMFREMREQRRQLERAMLVHHELSRTVFEAAGLAPLAETLARLIQRPVVILDAALHPLASADWPPALASAIAALGQALAPGTQPRGILQISADLSRDGSTGYAVAPIAVGEQLNGYIAVLESETPLDQIDAKAIEHAATIFALQLLHEKTAYEIERRLKGDLLQALFSAAYRDDAAAADLLGRLGYGLDGPWRIARLELALPDNGLPARGPGRDELHTAQSRLYPVLNEACVELCAGAPLTPWRSGFLSLISVAPLDVPDETELAGRLLERLRARAAQSYPGVRLYLAFGSRADSTGALGRSLDEAERTLAVAHKLDLGERPLLFEQLGVYRVLLGANAGRDHDEFVEEVLGSLRCHDAEHGSELVHTLQALVAADYQLAAAARRLYLHVNTLKYRLKKIQALLPGDPARGDLRFQVELALKILELQRLRQRP